MKTVKSIVFSGKIVDNVVRKSNPSQIYTRIESTRDYYEREFEKRGIDAPALANALPSRLEYLRRDPVLPFVERYSLEPFLAEFLPTYDYSSFMRPSNYKVDEPCFREYLSKQFREADPSTPMGKAIRQLLSFKPDTYYHLILCHFHLERFSEMYSEAFGEDGRNLLFELTPFSCYCDTKKDLEEIDPDEILHLHFLARIPDFKEFEKRVWSKLQSKTGKRNKTFKKIDNLFHYCSVILYLSQQRFVGRLSKHFLINTFLTVEEELSLLLVFPFLGVQKVIHYSKLQFLLHYDVYRLERNCYASEFSDLFVQIGLYGLPVCGTTFDFEAKEEISMFACFGEMLMLSFGNGHFVWNKIAKSFCQTLFTRKVLPEKQKTRVYDLSMHRTDDGGYEFSVSGAEMSLKSTDMDRLLTHLRTATEWENVCLRGIRSGVDAFKKLAPSFEMGREKCFKVIHRNYEFLMFFDYVASDRVCDDAVENVFVEDDECTDMILDEEEIL